jgi:beta-N-acetylhexosaminidase
MIDLGGTSVERDDHRWLQHPVVGGIILFARNFTDRDQVRELVRQIHALRAEAGGTPLLIAVDQEGGRVQRFKEGFTRLPPLRWLGHLHDQSASHARKLATLAARVMATEIIDTGVDFSFAPCIDIDRGACEVIGDRALHSAPDVVAELSLAYMQGMRQAGMAAVAKHFPGHGAVTGDSHLVLPEDPRPLTELSDDMRPYSTLIDDGLQGVMMAHIRYTECDTQIASLSDYWMNTVLRRQLGFNGAIFSDDLSMKGAAVGGDAGERALAALRAGADMVLVCNDRAAVGPVVSALENYQDPVAHARLAAMRANTQRYNNAPYGSAGWEADVETLQAALDERPALELDGGP